MENYDDNGYHEFFQFNIEGWKVSGNDWKFFNKGEFKPSKIVPPDDIDEVYNQGDLITELEFKKMMGEL